MIYFDISDLFIFARSHSTLSGVQRVSLLLLDRLRRSHGSGQVCVIGYHPQKKQLVTYDAAEVEAIVEFDQERFCAIFDLPLANGRQTLTLESYLRSRYKGPRLRYHRTRLSLMNYLTMGKAFKRRKIRPETGADASGAEPSSRRPLSDDVVFVPGATWNMPEHTQALRDLASDGVRIVQFVHDLIPLVASEFVDQDLPGHFSTWLRNTAEFTSQYVTNSRSTAADLTAFLRAEGHDVPIAPVLLAHEFVGFDRNSVPTDAVASVSAATKAAARLPFVLCVGTREPRKNCWTLARVWQELIRERGLTTPRLVFAGAPGWMNDDFDDLMQGTGHLGGYVRVVNRPSDHELAYLYQKALFTVYPSYYEGWGLPVGESLWFGKPVVCSHTSSLPEVSPTACEFIDPHDPVSLKTAILKVLGSDLEDLRVRIQQTHLRSWQDVADDLWKVLAVSQMKGDPGSRAHRPSR